MIAYEFYWLDPIKGYELVSVVPERRKNPKRILETSILNLGKKFLGDSVNVNNIFFVRRSINHYDWRRYSRDDSIQSFL